MPNPWSEGATRGRQRSKNTVGSVYGQRQHELLGQNPPPELIFFDDFVQIDSTQPNTNLYGSGALQFIDDFIADPAVEAKHEVIQLFLKAERPFNFIRSLILPFGPSLPRQSAVWASLQGTGTQTATNNLHFALLRVLMDTGASPVNPFALDQLTWNNSHAVIPGFTSTTALYATASNIELFDQFPLYGQTFGSLSPPPFHNFQIAHQARGTSYSFDQEIAKADNGLFWGIHIFWKASKKGGAPIEQDSALGKLDASLEGILLTGENRARVYGVTDFFDVMKGS